MVKLKETFEWLVVFTRPRAEVKLMQDLETLGYTCYLPMIDSVRKWSDRMKKVRTPLLPGILFVKTTQSELSAIYIHHHARFILKEFGKPAIVKQEEINNLNIIAREWDGKNIRSCRAEQYKPGDYVRIKRGNFKGLSGRLTEIKGRYRLLIQLNSTDLAFSVNVPASQAEKIAPKREMQVS
jgi:transcription antitermination factor NusG